MNVLPTAIGGYEIIRELGRGANGVVFAARRPGLERRFAVKVLLNFNAHDKEMLARFELEARVASKLDDPGVVGVFDVGTDPQGRPYYVMEYCEGETLQDRIKAGTLSLPDSIDIVSELARILATAHAKGVVHRDVKPANVIMDRTTGRPRIMDFGLARDRTAESNLTRTGDLIGTPLYMAPEQLRGQRGVDHRVDIYALGVILYECITGKRPFMAANVVELAAEVLTKSPLAPSKVRRGIPLTLDVICRRALAKEPDDRHKDCEELRRDLQVARRRFDEKVEAPRSRWPLVVGAILGALVVALGVTVLLLLRRQGLETPAPAPRPVVVAPPVPPRPAPPPPPIAPAPPPRPATPMPGADAKRLAATLAEILRGGGDDVSVVVQEAEEEAPLFALRGETPRPPASAQMVLTAAAAMKHCGDATLVTSLRASGTPRPNDVFDGDFAIVGAGDPTFHVDVIQAWMEKVRGKVRVLTGDLVVDARKFSGPERHPDWHRNDQAYYYGAPVSAMAVNDACIELDPDAPRPNNPVPWVKSLRYRYVLEGEAPSLVRMDDAWLLIMPERRWATRYAPEPEPDMFAAEIVKDALEAAGVKVMGKIRRARKDEDFASKPSPIETGRRVFDAVQHMGRRSQPWYAECLLRDAAVAAGKPGSFEGGAETAKELAVAYGARPEEVTIRDGSGRAKSDRMSARALVAVLRGALHDASGPSFARTLNTLPVEPGTVLPDRSVLRNFANLSSLEPSLERLGVRLRGQSSGRFDSSLTWAGYVEHGDRRVVVVFLARSEREQQLLLETLLAVAEFAGTTEGPRKR